MSDLPNPINRYEKYLNAIATGNSDDLPTPITREEVFLDYIAKNGGGSGSGEVTGVKGDAEGSYRRGNVNLTPTHLGLGNVDNTSDLNKPVSTAQQTALDGKVDKVTGKGLSENDYTNTDKAIVDGVTSALAGKVSTSSVGSANGVAELDANGRVPSSQLPSYVDDVLEYADLAHFPATGETGKIYIAEDTNKTYRWSGSDYAEISESLALGETSSTAYAGNKGKANADAIAAIKDGTNIDSFADVETALANKANSSDLGDKSNLTTTDKSSAVAAINEVVSGASLHDIGNDYTFADLTAEQKVTWFTNWTDTVNFPALYGSGVLIPSKDPSQKGIIYVIIGADGNGEVYTNAYKNGAWGKWNGPGLTYGPYSINNATDVKDFIKKTIQQAHSDLAAKKEYTLYNVVAVYEGYDRFFGSIERQDSEGYAFVLNKATGDNVYQGYYDISTDYIKVFRFDGVEI